MKAYSRQRLATMAIVTLAGVYCPAAMAEGEDFSVLTDLGTSSFDRGVGKEVGGFSLSTNVDYATGKYGGSQTIDTLTIPVIGQYVNGPWTYKLAVPYIRIANKGSATQAASTESGLDDVLASATYTFYKSKGSDPLVMNVAGLIKFGTASYAKGLGTGENDYAVQTAIDKTLGKFTASVMGGYRVNGDPPDTPLDNTFYGSLSGSYAFTPKTSAGLVFYLRQQSSMTRGVHRRLTAFFSHTLTKNWKAQAYVIKGLANGSADWHGGATLTYAFK